MAGPGGESGSGHLTPYTRLWETQEVNYGARSPRLCWSVLGRGLCGGGGAGLATPALRIPGGLSQAHLANMWLPLQFPRPVRGYFYPPDGRGRGKGVVGVSFGRLPAGGAPAGRALPAAQIPEYSCAPEGPCSPAFEPGPLPVCPTVPSGRTHRNTPRLTPIPQPSSGTHG